MTKAETYVTAAYAVELAARRRLEAEDAVREETPVP
jgi:hypothetical protein